MRERTTKRQLDVDLQKWCKILDLPCTQDERAIFVSACKLERRRAAYKAKRQALLQYREYFDWLQELPNPTRDDEELDDSWGAFMQHQHQMQHIDTVEERDGGNDDAERE